ncbi:MAG: oligopeptide transporter, OPT family, partial [Gemmatimonadetes bacterium]|nr:oligopeptide transporter, OPT family [Gemmatimonadota bacterium]
MRTQPSSTPDQLAELTLRSVVTGTILGIIFGASNAYLGLRVGLTVSASIPAAVMTVAVFTVMGRRGTILEANLSQTSASASTSLASGAIYTLPALFMWGMVPPYLQIVVLSYLGAVLGLAAMIPLRRLLIVQAHDDLPYPEGTACAEVLRATTEGSSASAWIFYGMAVGAAVKLLISLVFLVPNAVHAAVPVLPKADLALELAPALMGVGFILGYKQSGVLVSGSLVSAMVLTPVIAWIGAGLTAPLAPETTKLVADMTANEIWGRYVRYIGAGAVAVAGIITVLKGLPTMTDAFVAVAKGVRRTADAAAAAVTPRTDRDLPGSFVVGAIVVVVLVAGLVPGVFAGNMGPGQRAILAAGVGVFGLLFVTVNARIVGIVGVSSQPTSGVALITLLGVATVFAAAGWTDSAARAAVLAVSTIVAVAASKAGDISQDLKTGYLVGATPARQQFGQLIGASFACWAVAATIMLLGRAYEFGTADIPAPQATLMKTIVEGVLAGALPWGLVLSGGGLAFVAVLCGVSALAFAIGVYLPLATMASIYLGGCVQAICNRGKKGAAGKASGDPGVLAASGLVAGEGLAGVLVAGLV